MLKAASITGPRPLRVLIVGDDEQVPRAVASALPQSSTTSVQSVFDALFELEKGSYDVLLVHVAPIERRPKEAMRALVDQLAQVESKRPRLVFFGDPSLEVLAHQLLDIGGDDYLVLPLEPRDLRRSLTGSRPSRRPDPVLRRINPETGETSLVAPEAPSAALGGGLIPDDLPLATIVLDALIARGGGSLAEAVRRVNSYLPEGTSLALADTPPADDAGVCVVGFPGEDQPGRCLVLTTPADIDEAECDIARHDLGTLAGELAKLVELDSRHARLQRLALTDELTGCYNRRYFRHFLEKILQKAAKERFAVTLLLFDIDDFKHYNDRHGHGVGDAILRQTTELIRRCVRDHDLVARIGGDEFAVIFWEKEGPRTPHDPETQSSGRFPKGPRQIAERFRRLICSPEFTALGPSGQGTLGISGGMAVYPFDAQTPDGLIEAADRALLFGAKREGKNSISIVGDDGTFSAC